MSLLTPHDQTAKKTSTHRVWDTRHWLRAPGARHRAAGWLVSGVPALPATEDVLGLLPPHGAGKKKASEAMNRRDIMTRRSVAHRPIVNCCGACSISTTCRLCLSIYPAVAATWRKASGWALASLEAFLALGGRVLHAKKVKRGG